MSECATLFSHRYCGKVEAVLFRLRTPDIRHGVVTNFITLHSTSKNENMNCATWQIITLNNRAASLIDRRDYNDAVFLLRRALTMNKATLQTLDQSNALQESHSRMLQGCLASNGTDASADIPIGDDAEVYVYKSPLRLPETSSLTTDFNTHGVLSISIIFNLALVNHLSGLEEDPSSCLAKLDKAASLYTLAQEMLTQQVLDHAVLFIIVAATNNMGQIRKTQEQSEVADAHFQKVLSILLYMSDSRWENDKLPLEGFFQNTTYLVLKKSHTARAA
jgi:tetratricopeptide (TPR) repeat protein